MNLCDAYVTKILGPPYEVYGKWWVPIEYNCYGSLGETEVMFVTKEMADNLKVGFEFLV